MGSLPRRSVIVAVLVALLAACGGDGHQKSDPRRSDDEAATSMPAPQPLVVQQQPGPDARWPDCREVWAADRTLPSGYFGCALSEEFVGFDEGPRSTDSTLNPPSGHPCEDGTSLVVAPFIYGHIQTPTGSTVLPDAAAHFGRLGGRIERATTAVLAEDERFRSDLARCLGSSS